MGYKASSEQFAPTDLLRYCVAAEAAGFDSIFVSDHLQPWRHDGGHAPAALPFLGALAANTENVILGTSVLTPTFRYHPIVVAQAFATLGSMYPGRFVLGVGSGESLNESPLGGSWPSGKERLARLREAINLIRNLWADRRVDFDGQYYCARNATIYDRPEIPVPIYIGASGPIATKMAAELGDGYITTSGKPPELYEGTLLPAVQRGLASAQKSRADVDMTIEMKVSYDHDETKALHDTRHWAALALTAAEKTGVEDPVEMQRLSDALPLTRAASRWICSSDPDVHISQIKYYVDLGFRHLVFHFPGMDQERSISLYADEVLPRVRQLTYEESSVPTL